MKFQHVLAGLAGLAFSVSALAEDPNIVPGMWATTSTVTIESEQFPIPPRTDTTSNCVTKEKIAEGQAFLEDNEDCEFSEKNIRADGMDYTMVCTAPDGGKVEMTAEMKFGGETMTGTVAGDIESPMGLMKMKVELDGKRTGEC
ncbi:MAG: DUF3617 domain-containing protein [Xanthomonadaceae bacterium]|nr:DUF3617 domain-containing protein [Xanthomonadaceae bacterium]